MRTSAVSRSAVLVLFAGLPSESTEACFGDLAELQRTCLEGPNGGSGGNRTHDQWIKSPVLYRLSYRPTGKGGQAREGLTGGE